jgi:hypothetical protein
MIPSLLYNRLNGGVPFHDGIVHFMHTDKTSDLGRIFSHNANSAVGSCTSPEFISRQEPNCDYFRFVVDDVGKEYFRMKGRTLSTSSASTNAVKRARIDLTSAECTNVGRGGGSGSGSSGSGRQQATINGTFNGYGINSRSNNRQQTNVAESGGMFDGNGTDTSIQQTSTTRSINERVYTIGDGGVGGGGGGNNQQSIATNAVDAGLRQTVDLNDYETNARTTTATGSDLVAYFGQEPLPLNSDSARGAGAGPSAGAGAIPASAEDVPGTSRVFTTTTGEEEDDEVEMDRTWAKDGRFVISPGELQKGGSLTTKLPWKE